jgi:hypothetical protein
MQEEPAADLNVNLSERVRVYDTGSPERPVEGLIALMDALGAAAYSQTECEQFLESRDLVLDKLSESASAGRIDKERLTVFTFGDTVVIVYRAGPSGVVTLDDVVTFCRRLRAFMMHSLQNRIFFRGVLSVGLFYSVDNKTNTVMGPAVSDAAAWYSQGDWIGVSATPHASMFIQSLFERSTKNHTNILVDYNVPLKSGSPVRVKALNWPRAFYLRGLRPKGPEPAKSILLSLLVQREAPKGTESKYCNAVAFFDHVVSTQNLNKSKGSGIQNPT